eukprot:gene4477-3270_t
MFLAVFNEFSHPEVLEAIREKNICDIDVAAKPCALATSEEEKRAVRTNAKLIKMAHDITAPKSNYEMLTPESFQKLEEETDAVLEQLVALGFEVVNRHPVTSAGCPMVDRVILVYPE